MINETTITDDAESAEDQAFHLLVTSLEVFWSQPLPASGVVTVGRSSRCTVQLDDPLASREHLRIHIGCEGGVPVLTVEDLGSANGTRVRDLDIKPGEPAPVLPGEAILIGSTVLVVLLNRPGVGNRRIWSHAHFEASVDDHCARAAVARTSLALARIRFRGAAPWNRVMPVLAGEMTASHVFASYGPKDYEALFVDVEAPAVDELVHGLLDAFRVQGLDAQAGVAWYPKDGRSTDALLATANALLKAGGERRNNGEVPTDTSAMERVRSMARRAASSAINVLILGESGVGKDVLARLIHQMSPRAAKPFVAVNCASLTETLLESELFGHDKSAFTGAATAKIGLFESANGGTVLLDEIGEMSPPMQAKLLQAIDLREVRPVGAVRGRPIDVRFVAATNIDIDAAVASGTFREDLLYRLNAITLDVPPLRERRDEIEPLVTTFVAQVCRELGRPESDRPDLAVDPAALEYLLRYDWPGNIRQLKNIIERAVVLCDGAEILPEHLPLEKMRLSLTEPTAAGPTAAGEAGGTGRPRGRVVNLAPLADPEEEAQRRRILDALDANAWSQTRAAAALHISRRTLISKLDRYGIPRPQKPHRQPDESTKVAPKLAPPNQTGEHPDPES